jgi:hypothetical protein
VIKVGGQAWWLTPVHPSYLGGGDRESQGSRPAWAKNYQDPHFSQSAGCDSKSLFSQYRGGINRRVGVQAGPGTNMRPYFKNN